MSKAILYTAPLQSPAGRRLAWCRALGLAVPRNKMPRRDDLGDKLNDGGNGTAAYAAVCVHDCSTGLRECLPGGSVTNRFLGTRILLCEKCMGCPLLLQACPFQVPSSRVERAPAKMRKCDMCYERQSLWGSRPRAAMLSMARRFCATRRTACRARKRSLEKPCGITGK